ncbi:hypothetical protein BH09ACT8_BH09ACT8_11840 [soil metagenome]
MNQPVAPDARQPDVAGGGEPPADLAAHLARRTQRGTVRADSPSTVRRLLTQPHHVEARASGGALGRVPTIVAIGPFDDPRHAEHLAEAFLTVRQQRQATLVLLGGGANRAVVVRKTSERAAGTSVHVVSACDDRWSEVVAAADVVVLSSSSGTTTLLEVLAAGRGVVAPADPTTVGLIVPAIAGLVYRQGDLPAMTAALLRLLTEPALRRGMGGRAVNVARRHHLEAAAAMTPIASMKLGHGRPSVETVELPHPRKATQ